MNWSPGQPFAFLFISIAALITILTSLFVLLRRLIGKGFRQKRPLRGFQLLNKLQENILFYKTQLFHCVGKKSKILDQRNELFSSLALEKAASCLLAKLPLSLASDCQDTRWANLPGRKAVQCISRQNISNWVVFPTQASLHTSQDFPLCSSGENT